MKQKRAKGIVRKTRKRGISRLRMRVKNKSRYYTKKVQGGTCPCMMTMRGGDGVGTPTSDTTDGVAVPKNGLVGIPGISGSMDIDNYKEYFGDVLDGHIVPESRDF